MYDIVKKMSAKLAPFYLDVWVKEGEFCDEKLELCIHNPVEGDYTTIDIWPNKVEDVDKSIQEIMEYVVARLIHPNPIH